ncbi:MAG TPA: VOC family protein [Ktedonobacteraceae bacterium]|jgi:catechol 2,3-dioxygenase-like lactoylglutathione lyase family enzyme|nr:VOC family protein [Ktedonobacteraceae bacterium]
MITIRSLNHTSLLVRDVERSRRFYGQVLGMEEVPRPGNFDFPGAWFRKGSAEIHLIGEDVPGRVDTTYTGSYVPSELSCGHVTHFAFEIDDLEDAQRHLKAHGVEIVGGPRPRGDGVTQIFIRDPDGYVVELFVF